MSVIPNMACDEDLFRVYKILRKTYIELSGAILSVLE